MTESAKPVGHLLKAGDGTGIITKEDTTEGGKGGLERRKKKDEMVGDESRVERDRP